MKIPKPNLVHISIVGSIILFGLFMWALNRLASPIPPSTGYYLKIETPDSLSVTATTYKYSIPDIPDSVAMEKIKEQQYGKGIITFNRNPKIFIWIIIFSLMVAISFTLGLGVITRIISIVNTYKLTAWQIVCNIALSILFAVMLYMTNTSDEVNNKNYLPPFYIIRHLNIIFQHKAWCWIVAGQVISFTAAGITFGGFLILNSTLAETGKRLYTSDYKEIRNDLSDFLSSLSVLVVFSILTTAFIIQAIQVQISNMEKLNLMRSEFIYGYGFIFSSMLALIYVPINMRLTSQAGGTVSNSTGGESSFRFLDSFQSLVSILAPLLGGGVSELIKSLSV